MNTRRLVLTTVVLSWLNAGTCQAFHNPEVGRWLSRDPIGERGGVNLYCFVKNSPTHSIDRLGLDAGITDGNGAHSGIQVDLWDDSGNLAGCLKVDYHAAGFMGEAGQNQDGSSSSSSSRKKNGGSSGSSGDIISTFSTKGRVTLTVCSSDECKSPTRLIIGSMQQDRALLEYVLGTADPTAERWLEKQILEIQKWGCSYCEIEHFDGAIGWKTYRNFSNNCNDYSDSAIDNYLGRNWCRDLITDGSDLVEEWDQRYPEGTVPQRAGE